MPQIVNSGNKLIRINTAKNTLEFSQNGSITFVLKCANAPSHGDFQTININGQKLLTTTSKGLYYSRNGGVSWIKRN